MKRKRFSVEQIVSVLKHPEMRPPVTGLIRRVGISEQTIIVGKSNSPDLISTSPLAQAAAIRELVEGTGERADA